jgi:DNA (cytosine-5)-methyltransferase 1
MPVRLIRGVRPVYYNDNDPKVCGWLRGLCAAGCLPAGEIDARAIQEVTAQDLKGFAQCHFFAGIGGWAYALALAGWPREQPV